MAERLARLPQTFRKVVIQKPSTNFYDATEIISVPMPKPKDTEVLIKTKYLGVNATDINISACRYKEQSKLPKDAGLEAVGEIAALGPGVENFKVGQPVAYMGSGSYAEYLCVPSNLVCPVPEINPNFVALVICGRTAAIGLDKAGQIKKGERVLITAAAGGTGQMAVQYAKLAKCHVLGLCSSDEKVKFLEDLGCDRPINYKKENLMDVLKQEYPNGIDVVWETIGGKVFQTCLDNLAPRGRLIVIGFITDYKSAEGFKKMDLGTLPQTLLRNCQSVIGFSVLHYPEEFAYYHAKLLELYENGKIKIVIDQGVQTDEGKFIGLESVARAVEHLHSGTSLGKVVVELP